MINDLHDFESAVVCADLCIVGAGPAGIALAQEFAASSLDVLLLESGGLELDDEHRQLTAGESIGLRHLAYSKGRARVFGGAGTLWAGQCVRLDAIDFESRSWVPFSGWPLSATELDPYYDRAEAFFRIPGEIYDARVYERFRMKGPAWDPSELKALFTVYTPDVHTGRAWKKLIAGMTNVRLLLHSNVVDIRLEDSGRAVNSIDIRTLNGKQCRVHARAFALCAGGIENARLLLAANRKNPEGIGNSNGHVGRWFQEHPGTFTAEIRTDDPKQLQRMFRILYDLDGVRHFPKIRLAEQKQRSEQVLNSAASLLFKYPADSAVTALQEIYRALRNGIAPHGLQTKITNVLTHPSEAIHTILQRLRGQSPDGVPERIRLQCYLEQAPNAESRILLSRERDRLGMPLGVVDWQVTRLEHRTLQVLTETVSAEFIRLGLGEVIAESWLQNDTEWKHHIADCAHHCGTTRMATSPAYGVVDRNCQVFDVEGLFVCGSSVFPTSGYANPTLTIAALSIRLADHLKNFLSKRAVMVDTRQVTADAGEPIPVHG